MRPTWQAVYFIRTDLLSEVRVTSSASRMNGFNEAAVSAKEELHFNVLFCEQSMEATRVDREDAQE